MERCPQCGARRVYRADMEGRAASADERGELIWECLRCDISWVVPADD